MWLLVCIAQSWMPSIRIGTAPPSDADLSGAAFQAASAPMTVYKGSTEEGIDSLPDTRWWYVNRKETVVGQGRVAFERAAAALDHVETCFDHDWLTARCHSARTLLVVCSRQLGCLWLTNVNRILRNVSRPRARCVAWGTTTHHVLAGEERLQVRWDEATDEVSFEILSFSRPRHVLAWLGYPIVLCQQRRFARDATAVVASATQRPAGGSF